MGHPSKGQLELEVETNRCSNSEFSVEYHHQITVTAPDGLDCQAHSRSYIETFATQSRRVPAPA